jgi:hypothetical protein
MPPSSATCLWGDRCIVQSLWVCLSCRSEGLQCTRHGTIRLNAQAPVELAHQSVSQIVSQPASQSVSPSAWQSGRSRHVALAAIHRPLVAPSLCAVTVLCGAVQHLYMHARPYGVCIRSRHSAAQHLRPLEMARQSGSQAVRQRVSQASGVAVTAIHHPLASSVPNLCHAVGCGVCMHST